MNIIVLNGSPKGNLSGTLQYVAYLEKAYPTHQFETIHIAQQIKGIETNPDKFEGIIQQIRSSDALIWCFPLYYMMVHGSLKRFIELIDERDVKQAFQGKYCASISTSIHFFDHTAHNYIHAISDDMNMKYIAAFSPAMNDLLKSKGQQQLLQFGKLFLQTIEQKQITQPQFFPVQTRDFVYQNNKPKNFVDITNKKVVILHDALEQDHNLKQMLAHTRAVFGEKAEVYNIRDIEIKGGCQGCMHCGGSYRCTYEGKDDYIEFYKSKVMKADILVYAGTIKDRYLSSRWKTFYDRSFFNTHTPVLQNKQSIWLISGALDQNPNLKQILEAYHEFQEANLVGIVSDAYGTSEDIDQMIEQLCGRAVENLKDNVSRPVTFLGEGGMRIFRDEIWGGLRMVFTADHKAFRRLGYYKTFPQRSFLNFIMRVFLVPLLSIPAIRKGFNTQMKEQMVMPLKNVVAKARF
ncbi:MAG: NAD(P)H-dependent oxidoreductase [Anaerolineaceae bacterium]|nr:NAD(P)H-dependent oxidoreductase [Anaerolineaceae bacterium]